MQTSDFNYHLPESSIAQTPIEPRDSSRLLVFHRGSGELEHRIFREIGAYLHPDDLLVLNQTRVIPARIFARKPTGGVPVWDRNRRGNWRGAEWLGAAHSIYRTH